MAKFPTYQQGIGLIEVLITVVILSIGLLSVASLQARSVKNNTSSLERSMAILLTYSIADAMRVDRAHALAGSFDIGLTETPVSSANLASGNMLTFAQNTLNQWRSSTKNLLGETATSSVECNNTTEICQVIIQWDDSRATYGSSTQQLGVEVRL
ncbi:type IV pilus modification protein PilV [Thiolinea disciformis]|uniref:type IV pilus modification protein PilV n=1 Tax=Thiolinea disciformis TaxID=125614 RepID=UPI00036826C4|nr:type IV pilus modification protein PilV [Thiolinea disciformis]